MCEISHSIESIQPKISRHLALMRKSGLVLDEHRGQWVYYSVNPSLPEWAKGIIESTLENLQKEEPYRLDLDRMSSINKDDVCNLKY